VSVYKVSTGAVLLTYVVVVVILVSVVEAFPLSWAVTGLKVSVFTSSTTFKRDESGCTISEVVITS